MEKCGTGRHRGKLIALAEETNALRAIKCHIHNNRHSIYATAYMDTWRKDSIVMLLHHVVALTLIAFSYAFR